MANHGILYTDNGEGVLVMKILTMWFDRGLLEFNYPTQVGTECFDFTEFKPAVCKMFEVPISVSMLELDFERENLKYQDGNTVVTECRIGLGTEEEGVLSVLGYTDVDMSNAIGLVEDLVNGEMSKSLFQLLMNIEGEGAEPNQGIKDILQGLAEQRGTEEE